MSDRIVYKIIPLVLFVFILLLLAGYGLRGYTTLLNSDSYSYLIYAQSLAEGSLCGQYPLYDIFKEYWPSSGRLNLQSGNRHLINGRICYGVDIGYPLLLALAIKIGGFYAVHFVGPLFMILLGVFIFLLVRKIFPDDSERNILAVVSLLIVLLIPPYRVFFSSIKIMRDVPPLVFLIISLFLLLSGRDGDKSRPPYIFLAVLFLGGAVLIRINYAIAGGPFFLYLLFSPGKEKTRWKRTLLPIGSALMGVLAFIMLILIMDVGIHGNMTRTLQTINHSLQLASGSRTGLFSFYYFQRSSVWYLGFILGNYSIPLLLVALVGLIYTIRKRVILLLWLPLLVSFFLVFAFFKYKQDRYLLPVYFILSFFIGCGVIIILRKLAELKEGSVLWGKGLTVPRVLIFLAGLVMLMLSVTAFGARALFVPPVSTAFFALCAALLFLPCRNGVVYSVSRYFSSIMMFLLFLFLLIKVIPMMQARNFQLRELRHLRAEIEKYTSPGSLVLSTRYLKQNIDMYMHCFSLNYTQLAAPWRLPPERALQMVMNAGVPVFYLDNRGYRDAEEYLPALRENFQVTPVKRWTSEELGIRRKYFSERPYLQLYRVLPWQEKEVSLSFPAITVRDRILAVDLHSLWKDHARKEVRVFLNGFPMTGKLLDGVNFIYLDRQMMSGDEATLQFVSDRGLPANIPVLLSADPAEGVWIDLGKNVEPPDAFFQDGRLFNTSRSGRYRTMGERAALRIPTCQVPGRVPYLRMKVRNNLGKLSPVYLNLDLNRRSLPSLLIPPDYRWVTVESSLPAGDGAVGTSWITLRAVPASKTPEVEGKQSREGILSIDWVAVEWVPEDGNLPARAADREF